MSRHTEWFNSPCGHTCPRWCTLYKSSWGEFSLFNFYRLKTNVWLHGLARPVSSLLPSLRPQRLSQWTGFYKIWYESYSIIGYRTMGTVSNSDVGATLTSVTSWNCYRSVFFKITKFLSVVKWRGDRPASVFSFRCGDRGSIEWLIGAGNEISYSGKS